MPPLGLACLASTSMRQTLSAAGFLPSSHTHQRNGGNSSIAIKWMSSPDNRILIKDIQIAVADHFDIPLGDILSQSRKAKLVRARHIGFYIARQLTPHSLLGIGRRFCRPDHTTVLHGCRRIAERSKTDASIETDLTAIIEILKTARSRCDRSCSCAM